MVERKSVRVLRLLFSLGSRRQSTQGPWWAEKLDKCFEELLFLTAPGVSEKGNPLEMSKGVSKQP